MVEVSWTRSTPRLPRVSDVGEKRVEGKMIDEHVYIAIWDLEGIFCSSRHIPGVRFPGLIHPGIMGCAPSAELLVEWTRRESELVATSDLAATRCVALLPEPTSIHAGSATGELKARIGREGARTIPGRPEHGGNCDIKNLSRGSKTYLPVHIKGSCSHFHHYLASLD